MSISADAATVYRDNAVADLPSSGPNDPDKAGIRSLFGEVEAAISTVAAAITTGAAIVYATQAAMNADLFHPANTLGLVWNDPNPANDGVYVKTGGSGAGAWNFTSLTMPGTLAGHMEALAAQAGSSAYDAASDAAAAEQSAAEAAASAAEAAQSAATASKPGPVPWTPPSAWTPNTAYHVGPPASLVVVDAMDPDSTYVCLISHTSGADFPTDLAAGKWAWVTGAGATGAQGVQGFKGDPGGNVMAVGPTSNLAGQAVPAGITLVYATGFYADGDGGHGPVMLMPPGTPNGVVTLPDGRVGMPAAQGGRHNVLAWGMKPQGSTSAAGFDNAPIFRKMMAALPQHIIGAPIYFALPTIYFPTAVKTYGMGSTLQIVLSVRLEGESTGMANGEWSALEWPANMGSAGIRVENYNTRNGVVVPTNTSGNGSQFLGLTLIGGLPNFTVPPAVGDTYDTVSHGITSRTRIVVRDCYIRHFAGTGIEIKASGTGVGDAMGNANEGYFENCQFFENRGYGLSFEGADANANVTVKCGFYYCGLGGLREMSFIGNHHYGPHVDSCNVLGLGAVSYQGLVYDLISETAGVGGTTTPGSNSAVWFPRQPTAALPTDPSVFPAWVNGGNYVQACSLFSSKPSNVSDFVGYYLEGGYPGFIAPPASALGGTGGLTSVNPANTTTGVSNGLRGTGAGLIASYGVGGLRSIWQGVAVGNYTVIGAPAVGDQVTLNATTLTWIAGPSAGLNVQIGVSTIASAVNLAAALKANAAATLCWAHVDGQNTSRVNVIAKVGGTTANAYAMAATGAAVTPSGATMTGGSADVRGAISQAIVSADGLVMAATAASNWRVGFPNPPVSIGELAFTWANSTPALSLTNDSTALVLGRSAAVGRGVLIPSGGLVCNNTVNGRVMTQGTAIPSTGVAARGEIVFNTNAAAAGSPGWVCTTGGANGSTSVWKAMANLAA